ncbi:NAD-dependent epimerase/dehydratase family protein [uncultured Bacteroides sp.]|uniref:NAD-dependent epimerase/dehydratase family protein n=1 Tax=uncultured Bacteroides sp. TaxID=162156 RepID=UPI00280C1B3A|nr:NAD-dependent epimerase/dehydratase family protein [uncultured Bacteroides sp.]
MSLLFTGASGFLGNNILPLLKRDYKVSTIGLTSQDNYQVDISQKVPVLSDSYELVLHAAGKAHLVPKTELEKQIFFDVNLQGTKNLCSALEVAGLPKSFIFISTVAVYGCEFGEHINEDHPLNGDSPYALSKIMAEKFLEEWCMKHDVILSIIRPSLIAGPNAPGNLGAMVNGIKTGKYMSVAEGRARKSILMVQDIAKLIPFLVEKGGIYNVCDDNHPSFRELESLISHQLSKNIPFSIPYRLAKIMALIGDCIGDKAPINSLKLSKITKSLTFSNEKAKHELGWKPMNVLENYKIY